MPPVTWPPSSLQPDGSSRRGQPWISNGFERRRDAISDGVAFLLPARHTGVVTADQLEMISTDPAVMHGQAVIAGIRVPVSVILDCLAAGMTAEEITTEIPRSP